MSSPQNQRNLGTELEVLAKYKKRVSDPELLMIYNIVESALEKLDKHLREHVALEALRRELEKGRQEE